MDSLTLKLKEKHDELKLTDVEISSQDVPGWLVASEDGLTVALDIKLTDTLKKEGLSRDLVNRIQNLRKIKIWKSKIKFPNTYTTGDKLIKEAIWKNINYQFSMKPSKDDPI